MSKNYINVTNFIAAVVKLSKDKFSVEEKEKILNNIINDYRDVDYDPSELSRSRRNRSRPVIPSSTYWVDDFLEVPFPSADRPSNPARAFDEPPIQILTGAAGYTALDNALSHEVHLIQENGIQITNPASFTYRQVSTETQPVPISNGILNAITNLPPEPTIQPSTFNWSEMDRLIDPFGDNL